MMIETERLFLRPFLKCDLHDFHEYCAQSDVGIHAGWRAHESLEESADLLNEWVNAKNRLAIVLKKEDKVIGHICIFKDAGGRSDTRELGFVLHHSYHRQGFMKETVLALTDYLFRRQGLKYIWACCFEENVASRRLIESCGFTFMQTGSFDSKPLNKTFRTYEYRIAYNETKSFRFGEAM